MTTKGAQRDLDKLDKKMAKVFGQDCEGKIGLIGKNPPGIVAQAEICPHCNQKTFNNPCGHCDTPR